MAQELDAGEFWLPLEFLADDDLVTDFKTNSKRIDDFSTGFENSFLFNPHLSSPAESIVGSTETESDDDEFLTALTQKIAKSILQESNFYFDDSAKGLKLSCSPKSILFMNKSGSGWNSLNCVSPVSPPPHALDAVQLDLMNAAAGEVSRRRILEATTAFYSNKLCAPAPKLGTNTVPIRKRNSATEFYGFNNQIGIQLQQVKQNQRMMMSEAWRQGEMGYQFQNGMGISGSSMGVGWPTLQQWQSLQQQRGSGMRAVYHGETTVNKARIGTGVFLPQRPGTNPAESLKKPKPDDASLKQSNNVFMPLHKKNLRPEQPVVIHQELQLPQEWTY